MTIGSYQVQMNCTRCIKIFKRRILVVLMRRGIGRLLKLPLVLCGPRVSMMEFGITIPCLLLTKSVPFGLFDSFDQNHAYRLLFPNLDKMKDCGMIINVKVFTIVQYPYLNRDLQPAMNGSDT